MTTQPSASEWQMLQTLLKTLAQQAAQTGEGYAAFRGYQIRAQRLLPAHPTDVAYVEVRLTQNGQLIDRGRGWIH